MSYRTVTVAISRRQDLRRVVSRTVQGHIYQILLCGWLNLSDQQREVGWGSSMTGQRGKFNEIHGVSGWGPGDTAAWRVERTRADLKLEVRRGGAMTIPQLHLMLSSHHPLHLHITSARSPAEDLWQIPGTGRQVESQLRIFRKQARGLSVGQAGSKWAKLSKLDLCGCLEAAGGIALWGLVTLLCVLGQPSGPYQR